jgi:hypothetical protein
MIIPNENMSIEELEIIANDLQLSLDEVEAKIRIKLRSFDSLPMAKCPTVLTETLEHLSKLGIQRTIIQNTEKLIRVALNIDPTLEADIQEPMWWRVCQRIGNPNNLSLSTKAENVVEIYWRCASDLTWIVGPSDITWPGINVRTVHNDGKKIQTKIFWFAQTLIEHLLKNKDL